MFSENYSVRIRISLTIATPNTRQTFKGKVYIEIITYYTIHSIQITYRIYSIELFSKI